jgi:uncharacterized protein (TIGR03085 family)
MLARMTRYVRIERDLLADALLEAGPDAPTLCEGWTTHDLAAHVVIRERRPDAAWGIVFKPLAGWNEHVRKEYRDGRTYEDLVAMVRKPPVYSPLELPGVAELTNLLEFFVHHEDVRRGAPGWEPRALDPELVETLWRRVRGLARLSLMRFPATVAVESPGHGRFVVGSGEPALTVRGEPGELVLFFFGRQRATQVEIEGPEDLAGKLRRVRSGV